MFSEGMEFGFYDQAEQNANKALELYEDGEMSQALEQLEKNPLPDLVFMDDQMSVLSGTETMKIIRGRYDNLKVVVQSAHALVGDRARFLKQGFDAYLPKPFSAEQLNDILSLFPPE